MRHFVSLLFGIVLAPVIWFLAALGHYRFLAALRHHGSGLSMELTLGALLIVAAGIWLGILLGTRLSPIGPALAGLTYLGVGAAFLLDAKKVAAAFPDGPSGQHGLYVLPLQHGYAFLLGTALLVPLFNPARWRSRPKPDRPVDHLAAIEQPSGAHAAPDNFEPDSWRAEPPRATAAPRWEPGYRDTPERHWPEPGESDPGGFPPRRSEQRAPRENGTGAQRRSRYDR